MEAEAERATVPLTLSVHGPANIKQTDEMNDFTFIVGGIGYGCPRFVAEFLSRHVCELRRNDNRMNEIEVITKDERKEFGRLLSLGRGSSILIDVENRLFYELLSAELLNDELQIHVSEQIDSNMTIDNVFERLIHQIQMNLHLNLDFDYSREIEFITSHFHEIDILKQSGVIEVDLSIWSKILSSRKLKILSEDSLYEIVSSLVSRDHHYFLFLNFLNLNLRFDFVIFAMNLLI
jgi:hypothetical protein